MALPSEKRRNNFDGIRLLAALQVAVGHLLYFFNSASPSHFKDSVRFWLGAFPGVPIFFTISGFLIYASVESSQGHMARYWRARALRIYPALWVCTTLGAMMLWKLGYFSGVAPTKIAFWFATNMAAGGASLNPDFLRRLPAGVWNGALWTISVELTFYCLLPVICLATRSWKQRRGLIMTAIAFGSFCTFIYFDGLHWGATKQATTLTKVVWFSFAGNLWMFLFGSIARYYWGKLQPVLADKLPFWAISYVVSYPILRNFSLEKGYGVFASAAALLVSMVFLALVVLSAVYSYRTVSWKFLRGQDISYGLYLYHMMVFNSLLHLHHDSIGAGLVGIAIAIAFASGSWFLIEERCLRLKDSPRLDAAGIGGQGLSVRSEPTQEAAAPSRLK